MLKIRFLKTQVGDATLIDEQSCGRLLTRALVDCGHGPNYSKFLQGKPLNHLVVTHGHPDHASALPEVLDLPTGGTMVYMSGSLFSEKLMYGQGLYAESQLSVDTKPVIDAYLARYRHWASLDSSWTDLNVGLGNGTSLYDLNLLESRKKVVLQTANHRKLHKGCIVPVIVHRPFWIVLGADLEAGDWSRLYHTDVHFPRNIEVLQAPGHGRQRMKKEILRYLNPKYVVISSSAPNEEVQESASYYRSFGFQVFCLSEGDVVATINGSTFRIKQS